jgi:hypothetical protein
MGAREAAHSAGNAVAVVSTRWGVATGVGTSMTTLSCDGEDGSVTVVGFVVGVVGVDDGGVEV